MPCVECFCGGIDSKIDSPRPFEVFLEVIRADMRPFSVSVGGLVKASPLTALH